MVGSFDLEFFFVELFVVEYVQGYRGDGRLGVSVLKGGVGDETGDVLLKFSKVNGYIVFIELSVLVVLHALSHTRSEASSFEGVHHFLNQALHLAELFNHIVAL